jgi:hypothetical protein
LAALGVPLLFPTDRWLSESNILQDVRLWPVYANKSEIMKLPKDLNPSSPNSENFMKKWLQFTSWKSQTNVWLWDSVVELYELICRLESVNQSQMAENQLKSEMLKRTKFTHLLNSLQ